MTIVQVNNSLILILVLFLSCKPSIKEKKNIEKDSTQIKKDTLKKYGDSNIQINSLKDDFIGELIDTLPVKQGDTTLFRKWDAGKADSILFEDKSIIYKLKKSAFVNYYKTGQNKFSNQKLSLENTKTKEKFDFYTYSNHGSYSNPYVNSNISGYVEVEKKSKNKGKLNIFSSGTGDYFYFFQIKNGEIQITQIRVYPLKSNETHWYQIDTVLTVNKNNNLIDIYKLEKNLMKEKNIRR